MIDVKSATFKPGAIEMMLRACGIMAVAIFLCPWWAQQAEATVAVNGTQVAVGDATALQIANGDGAITTVLNQMIASLQAFGFQSVQHCRDDCKIRTYIPVLMNATGTVGAGGNFISGALDVWYTGNINADAVYPDDNFFESIFGKPDKSVKFRPVDGTAARVSLSKLYDGTTRTDCLVAMVIVAEVAIYLAKGTTWVDAFFWHGFGTEPVQSSGFLISGGHWPDVTTGDWIVGDLAGFTNANDYVVKSQDRAEHEPENWAAPAGFLMWQGINVVCVTGGQNPTFSGLGLQNVTEGQLRDKMGEFYQRDTKLIPSAQQIQNEMKWSTQKREIGYPP